ncbi:3'-5' exonuclease [Mesorhizobium atlanticum]
MTAPLTLIRVADTETTGLGDPKELVEIGWTDVRLFPTGWAIESGPHARLVNPGMPITPGARAAHHITDEEAARGMAPDEARALIDTGADLLCFHMADYDRPLIKSVKPTICTFKCAKDVYPDLESHKNGALGMRSASVAARNRWSLCIALVPIAGRPRTSCSTSSACCRSRPWSTSRPTRSVC